MTLAAGDAGTPSAPLLLSMADDEFVIGFSDSEWTGIAPILEEDVAISSLAQDELGHAQALYGLLADLVTTAETPTPWRTTAPPEGYRHARLLDHRRGDWARRSSGAGCTTRPTRSGSRRSPSRARAAGRARGQDPPRGALPPDAR